MKNMILLFPGSMSISTLKKNRASGKICSGICVGQNTYWGVEDHEALVKVVMLHGGVAVELG